MRPGPRIIGLLALLGVLGATIGGSTYFPSTSTSTTTSTVSTIPSGTANIFIDTNGGTCLRSSSAIAYVDSTACGNFQLAYQISSPGDTIIVQGGSYGAQTIQRGTHTQTGADIAYQCASGQTCTTGTLSLGISGSPQTQNSPNHLAFDGINITGGSLITWYNDTTASGFGAASTGISYSNARIQCVTSAAGPNGCGSHLLNLRSVDSFTATNVELGPMCCNGDAVELAVPRTGAPSDSNIILDRLNIHDLYDSCTFFPAAQGTCTGIVGFGDPLSGTGGLPLLCSATDTRGCDHVDGIQGFGCNTCILKNSRIYAGNPRTASTTGSAQGIFYYPSNGGTYSDLTFENNLVSCWCGSVNFWLTGDTGTQGDYSGFIKFINNTTKANIEIGDAAGAHQLAPGTTVLYANNIIPGTIHNTTSTLCTFGDSAGGTITPTFVNNLFGSATFAACGTGGVQGSPTFVSTDYFTPDLRLQTGSLGINQGSAVYAPATDAFGTARGASPDIGACECG